MCFKFTCFPPNFYSQGPNNWNNNGQGTWTTPWNASGMAWSNSNWNPPMGPPIPNPPSCNFGYGNNGSGFGNQGFNGGPCFSDPNTQNPTRFCQQNNPPWAQSQDFSANQQPQQMPQGPWPTNTNQPPAGSNSGGTDSRRELELALHTISRACLGSNKSTAPSVPPPPSQPQTNVSSGGGQQPWNQGGAKSSQDIWNT